MYFFGRGISAFFNQLFKWLFWNKTGQKLLFSILIVFIFFCFIKLGEVSAVEEVSDINYEVKSYYDGLSNQGILYLNNYLKNNPNSGLATNLKTNSLRLYFFTGSNDGSSYNNARPLNANYIRMFAFNPNTLGVGNVTNYDYLGVTSTPMYVYTGSAGIYTISSSGTLLSYQVVDNFNYPNFILTYENENVTNYLLSYQNGNEEQIIEILSNIEESLTNTEPTSETDSFVEVDSSSVDDLSSSSVDNVFSTMTTGFANKFTNYDLNTVNSFIWDLNGTRITFYSDTLYKMIRGTFFETLLSMLWYYIFGHYAFVWLSNIIHKIKDGSILDGLEVNEVITKEML